MNSHPRQTQSDDMAATKVAYVIYISYFLFCIPALPVIGVIFAYIFENDAKQYLKSHYQYLIRSFWIGLLYSVIAFALVILVIGIFLMPLLLIWWLIRMVKGMKSLMRNEPVINPTTWLF